MQRDTIKPHFICSVFCNLNKLTTGFFVANGMEKKLQKVELIYMIHSMCLTGVLL